MSPFRTRRATGALAAAAGLVLVLGGACAGPPAASAPTPGPASSGLPVSSAGPDGSPPPDGYFAIRPVGDFASLPDDALAADMVRRTPWEPRPHNDVANRTPAPPGTRLAGYSGMLNSHAVFGRVTGDFTGTTDEIIQWAAIKWGLPDELIRAEAVVESSWYQGLQDPSGAPINQRGYGDFGDCGGSPPGSPYGRSGPSSFGLLQVKWCAMENRPVTGTGGWPWTEHSTAYAVDVYAAVIRGCYEGWDVWLGADYRAGDLWGCVGRWFTGDWHSSTADAYADRVQQAVAAKPWLSWPNT